MISHNFMNTEKLRSWNITLLRYTLAACGESEFQQKTVGTFHEQTKIDKQLKINPDFVTKTAHFSSSAIKPPYINHPVIWNHNKVILHASSSKLAANPSYYGSYSLVFASCSGQIPKVVKAKQSVASFKLVKGSIIGLQTYLRKRQMHQFHYKWSFLAASADGAANVNQRNNGYGLTNIFIFPELDLLDYYAFEPLSGFDLIFDKPMSKMSLRLTKTLQL